MSDDAGGRKHIGDGEPEWRAYCVTCAAMKGVPGPHPADYYNFNSHPRQCCYAEAHCIQQVASCSVHDGVLDQFNRCAWCEYEKASGKYYNSIPLVSKIGYQA